jgi:PIN domain nuclease of toxin-antitoxin system
VNLLLDTHIWLWSLLEPERLSPQVVSALAAETTRRWLSPLSVWEAHLLIERKRLRVDLNPSDWIHEALTQAPVEEAPLTMEVALASRVLRSKHGDPVDRFLAATAQIFDLTLVTADHALYGIPGVRVLKNARRAKPSGTRAQR